MEHWKTLFACDERTEGFLIPPPEEFYQELLETHKLVSAVPDDVREAFFPILKLYSLAKFEYTFGDIADRETKRLLEMALSLRYQELEGITKFEIGNISLNQLIDWADEKGLLCFPKERVHHLRKIRNHQFHPRQHSFGGIAINNIAEVIDVINGLYEDPVIRNLRNEKIKSLAEILDFIKNEGGMLKIEEEEALIVDAWVAWWRKGRYVVYFCPPCEITFEGDAFRGAISYEEANPIRFDIKDCFAFSDSELRGTCIGKEGKEFSIQITSIKNDVDLSEYNSWRKIWKKTHNPSIWGVYIHYPRRLWRSFWHEELKFPETPFKLKEAK